MLFMNPPYSNLYGWLKMAKFESLHGATVVCILPCDTSTQWFHDFIYDKKTNNWYPNVEVRFPDRRYKFGDNTNSAKFATVIAIFRLTNDMAR